MAVCDSGWYRKEAMNWLRKILTHLRANGETLKPGTCECGHARCSHKNGKYKCQADWPPDEECKEWADCCCQIFILDDGGDDPNPEVPVDPEVAELHRMMGK